MKKVSKSGSGSTIERNGFRMHSVLVGQQCQTGGESGKSVKEVAREASPLGQ